MPARIFAAFLAGLLLISAGAGAPARTGAKRWEGLIDQQKGRALAGREEFALGCNRRDGLFMMVPVSVVPVQPARLVLVIDGAEFPVRNVNVLEDEGRSVLIATLQRNDEVFQTLRRGLEFQVITDAGKMDVGLFGAAELLRDMVKACFDE